MSLSCGSRVPVTDNGLKDMRQSGRLLTLYEGDKKLEKLVPARNAVTDRELVRLMVSEKEELDEISLSIVNDGDLDLDFHEQYIELVHFYVNRSGIEFGANKEDVVQECEIMVRQKLNLYDPERGALSNFIFQVCRSVICGNYHGEIKKRHRLIVDFVSEDGEIPEPVVMPPNYLGEKMKIVVSDLFDLYPDKYVILCEMFQGDPRDEVHYNLPSKICCAEIARKLDCAYNDVHIFYRKYVTPFFKSKFSDERVIENA